SLHHPDLHSFPTRRSSDLRLEHMEKCKPWDYVSPEMTVNSATGNPSVDWTPDKMKRFTPDALYDVFRQNQGGTFDTWARAEIARSEEHTSELQSLRHLVCR